MIALAVVGVLLALLIPAVQMVRETSRAAQCRSNLHQVVTAVANYEQSFDTYPGMLRGYHKGIAGFIEIQSLKQQAPVYACPADSWADGSLRFGRVSYVMNDGVYERRPGDGIVGFIKRGISSRDVTDGVSNTVALSERIVVPPSDVLGER
jgi:type II secretory pathway pseudopilin PulG